MLDLERDNEILELLKEKKACTVYELSTKLFVSESTVRRDLSRMEQKGLITRTFGGAIIKTNPIVDDTSFFLREKENLQEKRALAKAALQFVKSDTSIMIDSSTTCLQIVTMLNDFKNLVIITNGLAIANEIVTKTKHRLILLGGSVQTATNSVLGSYAEEMLEGFHASLAIMSTGAADAEFGYSEQLEMQAALKKIMLKNSDKSVILVAERKMGKKYLSRTAPISKASVMVSSGPIPDTFKEEAPDTEFITVSVTK